MIPWLIGSKLGRTLLGGVALLLILAGVVGYAQYERRRAQRAEASKAEVVRECEALKLALAEQNQAIVRLQADGAAQARRVGVASAEASRLRQEGEGRVQQILLQPAPSGDAELARWGAREAQRLTQRMETP